METIPKVPIHRNFINTERLNNVWQTEGEEHAKPVPLHIHILSIHRTTLWPMSGKNAQWNMLQCWMLLNKTIFHYINLEVAALQKLPRDQAQVSFNTPLYLRRYCNYFSQELWWDFSKLWYFYSCNCSSIQELHIKCPSSMNNLYLKEESKHIILRLKIQQWHIHYKKFHGN